MKSYPTAASAPAPGAAAGQTAERFAALRLRPVGFEGSDGRETPNAVSQ